MTDKELLELAAKAEGRKVWRGDSISQDRFFCECVASNGVVTGREWNPLTDDGDALRLATYIGMNLYINSAYCIAEIISDSEGPNVHEKEAVCAADTPLATRRAIVRAAAAIAEEIAK